MARLRSAGPSAPATPAGKRATAETTIGTALGCSPSSKLNANKSTTPGPKSATKTPRSKIPLKSAMKPAQEPLAAQTPAPATPEGPLYPSLAKFMSPTDESVKTPENPPKTPAAQAKVIVTPKTVGPGMPSVPKKSIRFIPDKDFTFDCSRDLSTAAKKLFQDIKPRADEIRLQMGPPETPSRGPIARTAATTGGKLKRRRFEDIHKAEFGKMDSIANHWSVKHTKSNGDKTPKLDKTPGNPQRGLKRMKSQAELGDQESVSPSPKKKDPVDLDAQMEADLGFKAKRRKTQADTPAPAPKVTRAATTVRPRAVQWKPKTASKVSGKVLFQETSTEVVPEETKVETPALAFTPAARTLFPAAKSSSKPLTVPTESATPIPHAPKTPSKDSSIVKLAPNFEEALRKTFPDVPKHEPGTPAMMPRTPSKQATPRPTTVPATIASTRLLLPNAPKHEPSSERKPAGNIGNFSFESKATGSLGFSKLRQILGMQNFPKVPTTMPSTVAAEDKKPGSMTALLEDKTDVKKESNPFVSKTPSNCKTEVRKENNPFIAMDWSIDNRELKEDNPFVGKGASNDKAEPKKDINPFAKDSSNDMAEPKKDINPFAKDSSNDKTEVRREDNPFITRDWSIDNRELKKENNPFISKGPASTAPAEHPKPTPRKPVGAGPSATPSHRTPGPFTFLTPRAANVPAVQLVETTPLMDPFTPATYAKAALKRKALAASPEPATPGRNLKRKASEELETSSPSAEANKQGEKDETEKKDEPAKKKLRFDEDTIVANKAPGRGEGLAARLAALAQPRRIAGLPKKTAGGKKKKPAWRV